jgi:hypothetical protein
MLLLSLLPLPSSNKPATVHPHDDCCGWCGYDTQFEHASGDSVAVARPPPKQHRHATAEPACSLASWCFISG